MNVYKEKQKQKLIKFSHRKKGKKSLIKKTY